GHCCQCFAPRQFRVAHASRVLLSASRRKQCSIGSQLLRLALTGNAATRESLRSRQRARRMRYLITGSERPALAAESGAASVSCAVSEWVVVWASVAGYLKQRLWQLASESQLAWPSKLAWPSQSRWPLV